MVTDFLFNTTSLSSYNWSVMLFDAGVTISNHNSHPTGVSCFTYVIPSGDLTNSLIIKAFRHSFSLLDRREISPLTGFRLKFVTIVIFKQSISP